MQYRVRFLGLIPITFGLTAALPSLFVVKYSAHSASSLQRIGLRQNWISGHSKPLSGTIPVPASKFKCSTSTPERRRYTADTNSRSRTLTYAPNETMVIKIRLARFGRRNLPLYNIVVAHARYVQSRRQKAGFSQKRLKIPTNPFSFSFFRNCSTARNSKPLEVIGTYDPVPKADPYENNGRLHKDIRLDSQRAKYWIGVGAQPTDTAWRLLSMVGILPKKQFGPVKAADTTMVQGKNVRIR